MPSYLCVTTRFLHLTSHGRSDGSEPEWPPSPLRLFQALVAASGARWNERMELRKAVSALSWLERQAAPNIVAPAAEPTRTRYRLYVPDNLGDRVAASWCRGGNASIAEHRVQKDICPMNLSGEAVHYLYSIKDADGNFEQHRETLLLAARSITHLGWGIDMVVGNASIISEYEAKSLSGERWNPIDDASGNLLRVPVRGTLQVIMDRHKEFLHRVTPDGIKPIVGVVPFRGASYRRASDPPARSFAAFSILEMDASSFRSFSTARRSCAVAGMARGLVSLAANDSGWPNEKIAEFVLGHGESQRRSEDHGANAGCALGEHSSHTGSQHLPVQGSRRFAYLPLPSIEFRGLGRPNSVGDTRRIVVTTFGADCELEIAWARRALSGRELIEKDSKKPIALLSLIPSSEKVVRRYTRAAAKWATVTPVVLPGHDDPAHYRRRLKRGVEAQEQRRLLESLHDRTEGLLRKAIVQAGFPQLLADHAQLEWRKVGFWPGTDLADGYSVPDHLRRLPRFHVRIRWHNAQNKPVQVPGPICIGGGRFYGLGLFAACEEGD